MGLGWSRRALADLRESWQVSSNVGGSSRISLGLAMTRGAPEGLNGSQRVFVGPARSQSLLVHFSRT